MRKFARQLILLATASVLQPLALAQEELLDEIQPDIKHYKVEIVVFAYAEDVSVGTEIFPPEEIEPPGELIDELEVRPRQRRHPDSIGLVPVLLEEDALTMHDIVRKFELLDAYEPLLHVGWIQAGFPRNDTVVMPLERFGVPPQGLAGRFTLYLERYLHLVVDLALDAPVQDIREAAPVQPTYVFGDSRLQFEDRGRPRFAPVRYRITENRIVKNNELRYFDHPKLGVVAKVSRIEESGEENPAL